MFQAVPELKALKPRAIPVELPQKCASRPDDPAIPCLNAGSRRLDGGWFVFAGVDYPPPLST